MSLRADYHDMNSACLVIYRRQFIDKSRFFPDINSVLPTKVAKGGGVRVRVRVRSVRHYEANRARSVISVHQTVTTGVKSYSHILKECQSKAIHK